MASNLAEILHLDLTTCKLEDFAEFYSDFEFEVNCDCKITAIAGCFDLMSCSQIVWQKLHQFHKAVMHGKMHVMSLLPQKVFHETQSWPSL